MKRLLSVALLIVAGSSSAACGGSGHDAKAANPDDVVGWSAELDQDSPALIEYFRVKSETYGCRTTTADQAATVEQCPEGPITMLKNGRKVTVACKSMTFDSCHDLFNRITSAQGGPTQ
jgi:hypothetical protein